MAELDSVTKAIADELVANGLKAPRDSFGIQVQRGGEVPAVNPEATTQRFYVTVTGKLKEEAEV